jgi:hypothetical protein
MIRRLPVISVAQEPRANPRGHPEEIQKADFVRNRSPTTMAIKINHRRRLVGVIFDISGVVDLERSG